MSLDVLGAEVVEGHGPSRFYRLEYVLDVCRGQVEEGVGGALRCVVSAPPLAGIARPPVDV